MAYNREADAAVQQGVLAGEEVEAEEWEMGEVPDEAQNLIDQVNAHAEMLLLVLNSGRRDRMTHTEFRNVVAQINDLLLTLQDHRITAYSPAFEGSHYEELTVHDQFANYQYGMDIPEVSQAAQRIDELCNILSNIPALEAELRAQIAYLEDPACVGTTEHIPSLQEFKTTHAHMLEEEDEEEAPLEDDEEEAPLEVGDQDDEDHPTRGRGYNVF